MTEEKRDRRRGKQDIDQEIVDLAERPLRQALARRFGQTVRTMKAEPPLRFRLGQPGRIAAKRRQGLFRLDCMPGTLR